MASFEALSSYYFLTNFFIGCCYFITVYGLGSFVFKLLPFSFTASLSPALKTITGFLTISLIIQVLAFFFWINDTSLRLLTLFLLGLLIWQLSLWQWKNLLTFNPKRQDFVWVGCFFLCLLPLFFYAILPSTKIDELFYHQLVGERIVIDGGLVFYRQPWEAAIPPHLLYNFSHVPLVHWGFPDAANVVSLGVFGVSLSTVYVVLKEADVSSFLRWIILSLACLGMYRLTFTTAGSHHFGDLAAFMGLYVVFAFSSLKRQMSIRTLMWMSGVFFAAMAGAKMSLLPFAALLGVVLLYELWQQKVLYFKNIALLLLPIFVFYVPIILWTYLQTNSPLGLMLSQYFDTKIIDQHLREATMQEEVVNTPHFFEHVRTALMHFPYVLLLSPLFFAASGHTKTAKIKILGVCAIYLVTLYAFQLLYHPRFWGNIPLTLGVLTALAAPRIAAFSWLQMFKTNTLRWTFFTVALFPYLAISYYYLYHLQPFPFGEASKKAYYKKFIPLYEDYKALDALLPKDACLFTQNRISLIHAPRRIFKDTLDICNCTSIYALQCDTLLLPASLPIQHQIYTLDSLVYQNTQANITIYRTPNKLPKTGTLLVYKLRPVIEK